MAIQVCFDQLLSWARSDDNDAFSRGYTLGFMACSVEIGRLEPWQGEYVRNISRARAQGVSA